MVKMESGEVQILSVPLRLLKLHGLWQESNQSNIVYITRVIFILIIFAIPSCGCILHLVHSFIGKANYCREDILEDIAIISSALGLYVLSTCFIIKRKALIDLVVYLNNFERFGMPPSLSKTNDTMNFLCKVFYAYATVGVFIYCSFGLINKKQCEEESLKNNLDRACGLVYPIWLPFEHKAFPRSQILYILQFTGTLMISSTGILLMSFFIGIVEVVNARVIHFKKMISKVFDFEDSEERRKYLRTCVQYHTDIISIVASINFALGKIFFMFVSFASFIISVIGFQFILQFELRSAIHMMGWIIVLSMPCYAGQRLIDETSTIPTEIYLLEWYKGDVTIQKDILFMITRANYCLHLDCEGFGYMSFSTLLAVLQTSYSYLTLLYKTYN